MNHRVFNILEYDKIINSLENFAKSEQGKKICRQLKPITDINVINKWQVETQEAVNWSFKKGFPPFINLPNIYSELTRVAKGATLTISELYNIKKFISISNLIINYSRENNNDFKHDSIFNYFESIDTVTSLYKRLKLCINGAKEINDEASLELVDIRLKIKSTNVNIKEVLNNIISSSSYRNMLQDNVITVKSGRYCVPVKHEYKSAFPGITHDQSASGVTFFIEPLSVLNLNNDLKDLRLREDGEIEIILKSLTQETLENKDTLNINMRILAELDFIFAKAELSINMDAVAPILNKLAYVNIKKGRHPLLNKDKVVPIDITSGQDFFMLLITGPNTGGKTVSLKLVGLFTLMAQSGLHISADQGSELAVFDNVYADIGDEQSIEQSLSTFSGHMSNIVKILSKADEFSLVLLDELGAGTDPVEGAALAVAILQYLYDKHISTFVTTHYSELKLYAISTPGVENAACEFDINNLKPTYRLLIGAPGKSNAFAISSKLGLDTSIIEKAKQMLKTDDIRFEDIITDLHLRQGKQADEEQKIERDRKEIAALRKELKIERDKLLSRKEKILLDAKIRSEEIIRKSKEEVDELVREILRKKRNNETIKSMDETRDKLRAKLKDAQASLKTSNKILISKDFKEGDKVLVNSFNQLATIISLSKNEATVQMGSIRLNIALSDLSWTDKMHKTKPDANINVRVKRKNVSNILDLRGKLVSESLDELDKYLSEACLSNLAQISIIHGKGTGALRSAIHAYLKKQTVVLEYRLGSYGEGDTGITMVKLR